MICSTFLFLGSILSLLKLKRYKNKYLEEKKKKRGVGTPHPAMSLSKYQNCIYLDYNGTTPIWEEIKEAMEPFTFLFFGNPSSSHIFAKPCKEAVRSSLICFYVCLVAVFLDSYILL